MQQLMTEEIAKTVPRPYGQDDVDDPIVHVHYFSCVTGWDWYMNQRSSQNHQRRAHTSLLGLTISLEFPAPGLAAESKA